MAGIIPRNQASAQMEYRNPVPIAGTTDARIMGEAMASFGRGLTDVGRVAIQQYNREVELDRGTRLAEGKNELTNMFSKPMYEQAAMTSAEDGSDIGQKFYEKATPGVNNVLGKFKSDAKSYAELSSYARMLQEDANSNLAVLKTAKLQNANYQRIELLMNSSSDRLRANPTEDMMATEMRTMTADLEKMVSSGGMDADTARKVRGMHQEKQVLAFIDGLHNKEDYGKALNYLNANQEDRELLYELTPEDARKNGFIDGTEAAKLNAEGVTYKVPVLTNGDRVKLTPEMSDALNRMPQDKKAHLIDLSRAKAKDRSETRLVDLYTNINGYEKLAAAGSTNIEDKRNIIKQINENGNMTIDAKRRMMDRVNTAEVVGNQLRIASNTKLSELSKLDDDAKAKMELSANEAAKLDPRMGVNNSDFGILEHREEQQNLLRSQLGQMTEQIRKDAASFYTNADDKIGVLWKAQADGNPEATKAYINAVLTKQTTMEVPTAFQRILPKGATMAHAQALQAAPTSTEANQVLENLRNQYGEHFPRVMQEITKDNEEVQGYLSTVYLDPNERAPFLDAVKNEKAINETFKKSGDASSGQNSINKSIRDQMSGFRQAVMGSSNDSGSTHAMNSFEKTMDLYIKRELNKDPSLDEDDLAKKAYSKVVDSQYQIVGSIVAPKYIRGSQLQPGLVQAFVSVNRDRGSFDELGVGVPKEYKNDPHEYLNEVLPKRARWVTNETQTGVSLMHLKEDGRLVQVKNKFDKPLEVSFEDMMLRPQVRVRNAYGGLLMKFGIIGKGR